MKASLWGRTWHGTLALSSTGMRRHNLLFLYFNNNIYTHIQRCAAPSYSCSLSDYIRFSSLLLPRKNFSILKNRSEYLPFIFSTPSSMPNYSISYEFLGIKYDLTYIFAVLCIFIFIIHNFVKNIAVPSN